MSDKESNALPNKESLLKRSTRFIREVRKEVSQVVFPTRHDASITTLIVCIFAFLMSLYLLLVDRSILFVVQSIMG
jgi:preprotein translocase subunit SecE